MFDKKQERKWHGIVAGLLAAVLLFSAASVIMPSFAATKKVGEYAWGTTNGPNDKKLNGKNGTSHAAIGQCTGYVRWAVNTYYFTKSNPYPGGVVKNQRNWLKNNAEFVGSVKTGTAAEFNTIYQKIRPGDIVVFNSAKNLSGTWSHTAIIGGDRKTLHHATTSKGVVYSWELKAWMNQTTGVKTSKSCEVYRILPLEGKGSLKKASSNTGISSGNTDYSLNGAIYWVYTNAACTVRAKTPDGKVAVFTTNANGDSTAVTLRVGTYYVKEKTAPKGYALDNTVYKAVVSDGKTTQINAKDIPQSAPVSIQKINKSTGDTTPPPGKTWEGNEFELVYTSTAGSVKRTWKVRTDANGYADLSDTYFISQGSDTRFKNSKGAYVVPLGNLTVKETKASDGAELNGYTYELSIGWDKSSETTKTVKLIKADENGVLDSDGLKIKIKNNPSYAEYEMYKIRNEKATPDGRGKFGFVPGDYVTYDVVVKTSGTSGKITLDVSDEFTEHPEYFTKPEVISVKNAVQNSISKDKNKVNITIDVGETATVTYGAYVKKEAAEYLAAADKDSDSLDASGKDCNKTERTNSPDENDGYRNIAKTTGVTWKANDSTSPQPMEDKNDDAQTPVRHYRIITSLTGEQGGKIIGGSKATLKDTVSYEGFTPGKSYIFEGKLYVKETGEPLTADGEPVTAKSDVIVPTDYSGTADVFFDIELAALGGKELVAYEYAYEVKDEKNELIAAHEDINDTSQTVEIPGYKMYKVRKTPAPENGSGSFGFDPGDRALYDVFIENISKSASITMDVTDQFTENPEYFTVPKVIEVQGCVENSRSEDGNKINITVKAGETAVVTYEAYVQGGAKEYLAGDDRDSDSLDANGEDCNMDDRENSPDEEDGYRNFARVENPVPENPDNPDEPVEPLPPDEDDAQTPVKTPEINTYLSKYKGGKDLEAGTTVKIKDRVEYTSLTPGKTYAFTGELVDSSGKVLVSNGKPVRSAVVFTPEEHSGQVEVPFTFDTEGLDGESIIAYETAYVLNIDDSESIETPDDVIADGVMMVEHKDLENKDQTVTVMNKPGCPKTGEDPFVFLYTGVLISSAALLLLLIAGKRRA